MVLPQPVACFVWSCVWCVTHAVTCKGLVVQGWIPSAVLSLLCHQYGQFRRTKLLFVYSMYFVKKYKLENTRNTSGAGHAIGCDRPLLVDLSEVDCLQYSWYRHSLTLLG